MKCKEETNTNNKLSQAPSVIKCGVYHVWFLTHIDKARITWSDLSPRFFCHDATLLCEFESDKI